MAKGKKQAKKTTPKQPKKPGKYDMTVKAPEGMTFEDLLKMAVNTPPLKKKKSE